MIIPLFAAASALTSHSMSSISINPLPIDQFSNPSLCPVHRLPIACPRASGICILRLSASPVHWESSSLGLAGAHLHGPTTDRPMTLASKNHQDLSKEGNLTGWPQRGGERPRCCIINLHDISPDVNNSHLPACCSYLRTYLHTYNPRI